MPTPIREVADRRVTDTNPPRDDIEGLDHERCTALHNAIVKHAWTASGRPEAAFPATTWWNMQHISARDTMAGRLHPSVVQFLRSAFVVENEDLDFFYYLSSLRYAATPHGLLFKEDEEDPDRYLTLYGTTQAVADNPDGLIYDQEGHVCLLCLNTDEFDPDESQPWQKLESVLSVYLDMIETGKVVAVHKDLEYPNDMKNVSVPGMDGMRFMPASERPNAMLVDPVSGHPKPMQCVGPWMIVPYTGKDVNDTLAVWAQLIEAIHSRLPEATHTNGEDGHGLYDAETLDRAGIQSGFAHDFFSRALKPRFRNIAPGLRIQTGEELAEQPYRVASDQERSRVPPILLFRGEGDAAASPLLPPVPDSNRLPVGLYLEDCDRDGASPFEDASRLLLPFTLGGGNSWVRTSDDRGMVGGRHDMLYQIGVNPFLPSHAIQLMGILTQWYHCIVDGYWEVNLNGVAGRIGKFRDANTEERFAYYYLPIEYGLVY